MTNIWLIIPAGVLNMIALVLIFLAFRNSSRATIARDNDPKGTTNEAKRLWSAFGAMIIACTAFQGALVIFYAGAIYSWLK